MATGRLPQAEVAEDRTYTSMETVTGYCWCIAAFVSVPPN
jgi:hypothetical protein